MLYDLGNCAFRQGRFAEAVRCYRSALRLRPRDRAVRFNLRLAEERLGTAAGAAPPSFLRALSALPERLTPWELLLLSAVLQAAGLTGLLLARGRVPGAAAVLVLLLGLGCGARLVRVRFLPPPPEAVVLVPDAALRPEPHRSLSVLERLPAGARVRVLESSDRWARVERDDGTAGWTERSALGMTGGARCE